MMWNFRPFDLTADLPYQRIVPGRRQPMRPSPRPLKSCTAKFWVPSYFIQHMRYSWSLRENICYFPLHPLSRPSSHTGLFPFLFQTEVSFLSLEHPYYLKTVVLQLIYLTAVHLSPGQHIYIKYSICQALSKGWLNVIGRSQRTQAKIHLCSLWNRLLSVDYYITVDLQLSFQFLF